MKKLFTLVVFLFVMLLINKESSAQLKIGFKANEITRPDITLLELAVGPSATTAKGMVFPMSSTSQRNDMSAGGAIPKGMTVLNSSVNRFQFYDGANWIDIGNDTKSNIFDVTLSGTFDSKNGVFTIEDPAGSTSSTLKIDGYSSIVYNNVILKPGTDYTINASAKTVTFTTLIPDEVGGFSVIRVEYN